MTLNAINCSSWNGSAWTLVFEFGCYIAIAFIVKTLLKLNIKKDNLPKFIFGIYVLLIIISLFYPRLGGIPERNLLNLFSFAVNLFSIFLGGSIIYLIKDKIVFKLKYLIIAFIF